MALSDPSESPENCDLHRLRYRVGGYGVHVFVSVVRIMYFASACIAGHHPADPSSSLPRGSRQTDSFQPQAGGSAGRRLRPTPSWKHQPLPAPVSHSETRWSVRDGARFLTRRVGIHPCFESLPRHRRHRPQQQSVQRIARWTMTAMLARWPNRAPSSPLQATVAAGDARAGDRAARYAPTVG